MHPAEVREFMRVFQEGAAVGTRKAFEPFIRMLSETKNANINYIYALSGKSPLEQNPGDRPFAGIMTYPRGTGERLFQNGINPLIRAMDSIIADRQFNVKEVKSAIGAIMSTIVVHTLTSVVYGSLVGEKRGYFRQDDEEDETKPAFGLGGSIFYQPIAPGVRAAWNFFGGLGMFAVSAFQDDEENFEKNLIKAGDAAFYYVPIANDMATWMESVGNVQGASNMKLILKKFKTRRFKRSRRDFWASLVHGIFNTAEGKEIRERFTIEGLAERAIDAQDYLPRRVRQAMKEELDLD